jgi:hypothetical protein
MKSPVGAQFAKEVPQGLKPCPFKSCAVMGEDAGATSLCRGLCG